MRHSRVLQALVVAVAGVVSLSGCGSGGSSDKSFLFGAVRLGTSDLLELDANNEDGRGLAMDGFVALAGDPSGNMLVGWEHYDDGSVYWYLYSHVYRGAVVFDIDLLGEGAPKTVTKALLRFDVETGKHAPTGGFFETSKLRVYLAGTDWHGYPEVDAPASFPVAAYPAAPLSTTPAPGGAFVGSKVEIDVTDAVRDWKNGVRPNRGFVLAGSPEIDGLWFDNDAWWQILGNFELRVFYK